MATLVRIAQIETLQGQTTVLHDIDWQQFGDRGGSDFSDC